MFSGIHSLGHVSRGEKWRWLDWGREEGAVTILKGGSVCVATLKSPSDTPECSASTRLRGWLP